MNQLESSLLGEQIKYEDFLAESPERLREAIKKGIKSLCFGSSLPPTFQRLLGGFSHSRLYSFQINGERFVLRILDYKRISSPEDTFTKRLSEVLSHRAASVAGIAADIHYSDPEALIVIMDYLEGASLCAENLLNRRFLLDLGASVCTMHSINVELPFQRSQDDRITKHYLQALSKGVAFPTGFQGVYDDYMRVSHDSFNGKVFCHGDLNSGNIILQKERPYYIDWAGANIGDPYTDLGYITLLSGMNHQQSAVFLEGYLGHQASAEESAKLFLAQARTCFLTAVVWFDFSETEEEREVPISERVLRLDEKLASPNLSTVHDYIVEGKKVNPLTGPTHEVLLFALSHYKEYLNFIST